MSQENFYHNPTESGYWTHRCVFNRDIKLQDSEVLQRVIPIGIREHDGTLEMVLSTFEGKVFERIDRFLGLSVVRGDSQIYPNETDGELLIEFTYYSPKNGQMEVKPRRIRPTAIMFGIFGDTSEESATKGGHRALGESADYYLVGYDTQYNPSQDPVGGIRNFPFWRCGVWGNPIELAKEYLPQLPQ